MSFRIERLTDRFDEYQWLIPPSGINQNQPSVHFTRVSRVKPARVSRKHNPRKTSKKSSEDLSLSNFRIVVAH